MRKTSKLQIAARRKHCPELSSTGWPNFILSFINSYLQKWCYRSYKCPWRKPFIEDRRDMARIKVPSERRSDLGACHRDMVSRARWSCLSISETADPAMCTHNTLWSLHRMVWKTKQRPASITSTDKNAFLIKEVGEEWPADISPYLTYNSVVRKKKQSTSHVLHSDTWRFEVITRNSDYCFAKSAMYSVMLSDHFFL